jgi:glucosamine--fructose-6-phosphate aminotransferase (isomerizing)
MSSTPGRFGLEEILSQPQCWKDSLEALESGGELKGVESRFASKCDWLFVGCGSSYYVAQAAAATWSFLTHSPAYAVPASDVLLFPELVIGGGGCCQPVLISRSGHTSEILKVADELERNRDIRTLAISCAAPQPLEQISTACLHVLPADEQSTVMTRSFTTMLLGLQLLAARRARNPEFAEALFRLPDQMEPQMKTLGRRIEEFVNATDFPFYAFLGQGPFLGIANEGMLKVKEMGCSYSQSFHTLEFRHGPKAIVAADTLTIFLLSESGKEAERDVLEEVKSLGGTTLVVTNEADEATRRNADLLIELRLDVPEFARLAPYALVGQLLGLYTGLKRGLDPDRPRHLSRVVMLNNPGK